MRCLAVLAAATAVHAKSIYYYVNTLEDNVPASYCPDGPNSKRQCTYRKALEQAGSTHESTPIVIVLPPGQINISSTAGALPVLQQYEEQKHVSIIGNWNTSVLANPNVSTSWRSVVDGNNSNILLEIMRDIDVVVANITFQHGSASASETSGKQRNGGAITTSGNLEVSGCVFGDNAADSAGGAIANDGGNFQVNDCVFLRNSATNGGAVSSEGKASVMTMRRCTFRDNTASEAAGAIQISRTAAAVISDTTFENHHARQTGGALQNGVNSNMTLSNCTVKVASAKNAGLFSNAGIAKAYDVTFEGGFAFDQNSGGYGGGVDNQGDFTCVGCAFRNNSAQQTLVPPTQSRDANGATLNMDQKAGATALLLNCTIEGNNNHAQDPWTVSEIYLGREDVTLNLTFCKITNCHDNMIMINNDKTFNTVTMRGTHFCDTDKSETDGACATTQKGQLKPGHGLHVEMAVSRRSTCRCGSSIVKGCADATADPKHPLWMCGERAACIDLHVAGQKNNGLGINCSLAVRWQKCHNPGLLYEPKMPTMYDSMWGYPFGGVGPDMSPLDEVDFGFPLPAMKQGCFEQWNAYAANITATLALAEALLVEGAPAPAVPVEALPLWPELDFSGAVETRTAAYTCVTRAAAGINWTVVANASDHAHVNGTVLPNKTFEISLSEETNQTFVSTSFTSYAYDANVTKGKLITGHAELYTLNVTMVPGDFFCQAGQVNTTCFNDSGAPALCVAKSFSPKDCHLGNAGDYGESCEAFNGSQPCSPALSTALACPFAQWGLDFCECADCLAGAVYSCQCGTNEGTQTCSEAGTLGDCDCTALWNYPPSSPPPSSPPPPPPLWPKIVFPSCVGAGLLLGGLFCWMRRRRSRRMAQEYQDALVNAQGAEGADGDDAAYVLQ